MTSKPAYRDYFKDILEAIKKIGHFIEGMSYEQFAQDDKTVFAVIRAMEDDIGRLAKFGTNHSTRLVRNQ